MCSDLRTWNPPHGIHSCVTNSRPSQSTADVRPHNVCQINHLTIPTALCEAPSLPVFTLLVRSAPPDLANRLGFVHLDWYVCPHLLRLGYHCSGPPTALQPRVMNSAKLVSFGVPTARLLACAAAPNLFHRSHDKPGRQRLDGPSITAQNSLSSARLHSTSPLACLQRSAPWTR